MTPSSASVRGISHYRHYVGKLDAFLALCVKRELADLAARGEAVAAEQRQRARARFGRERQIRPRAISSSISARDRVSSSA